MLYWMCSLFEWSHLLSHLTYHLYPNNLQNNVPNFSLLNISMWKKSTKSQIQMWGHPNPLKKNLHNFSWLSNYKWQSTLTLSPTHWHSKIVIAKLANYNLNIIVANITGIYHVLGTILSVGHILINLLCTKILR